MSKTALNIQIAIECDDPKQATTRLTDFIKDLKTDEVLTHMNMYAIGEGTAAQTVTGATAAPSADAAQPTKTKAKRKTKKEKEAEEAEKAALAAEETKGATDDDEDLFDKPETKEETVADEGTATTDDLRSAIRKFAQEKSTDAAREILAANGYKKATDIPESKAYDFIVNKLKIKMADIA